jgi:hypothetical protein
MTSELSAKKFKDNLIEFYRSPLNDKNGRYRSWDFCYSAFKTARIKQHDKDFDTLAQELQLYLASWGMLRGSSKLLTSYNYKIHTELIRELSQESDFDQLYNYPCNTDDVQDYIETSLRAYSVIRKYYDTLKISKSDILFTKILLGVFACSPAYDTFLRKASRNYSDFIGTFNKNSLNKLWKYYFNNCHVIPMRCRNQYPPMKLMDMALFDIGRTL